MTNKWKGIFKVMEECGELVCELGKLGPFPSGEHPDGKGDLKQRVENELADVQAACLYMVTENKLDHERIGLRLQHKLTLYRKWGLSGIGDTDEEPVYEKDGRR